MIETEADANKGVPGRWLCCTGRRRPVCAFLAVVVLIGAGAAEAGESSWILAFEPMYMEVSGHDPEVLAVGELGLAEPGSVGQQTRVELDTEAGFAYRVVLQNTRGRWGWGVDIFSLATSQDTADRTAAADGPSGPIRQVVYETANQVFTSSDASEILFYGVLGDTDLAAWTVDFYATRVLLQKPSSGLDLQFGLRLADFDNDYRAVVGLQGVEGARLDASSNYDRMTGPLVGLIGDLERGKSHFTGYLGQSVVFGSAELSSMSTAFTGSFTGSPSFSEPLIFEKDEDVTIPITDLRFKWTYRVSRMIALGAAINTSVWWDVSVPPGVEPGAGLEALHESTLVFFGLAGVVELSF